MNLENNDDYYLLDSDSLAFKNPSNILTQKKADMITNEFIKPVEEKQKEKVLEPVLHEQIANTVILLMKDEEPITENIFKYDLNYKFPRLIFLLIFFFFLGLLLYLVYGLISTLN